MNSRSQRERGAAFTTSLLLAAGLALFPFGASAHIGSNAVVSSGNAGPYHLLVTIQPPEVVPGIAAVDVLAADEDLEQVSVVPVPLRGEGTATAPVPDSAHRDVADRHLFSSSIWLMQAGAWQVRIAVDGPRGQGTLAVPVPALARTVRPMPRALVGLLIPLLALLVAGAIAIVAASVRDADLRAGDAPSPRKRRRARIAAALAAGVLALGVVGGRSWWVDEARASQRLVYKPMRANAMVQGATLQVTLDDPGWLRWRRVDDLVPDHGHLMHLFAVRTPALDAIAHLHPAPQGAGAFAQALPPLPGGRYHLFADIVHASGLDETATATVELPNNRGTEGNPPAGSAAGAPADADDSWAMVSSPATPARPIYRFSDGAGQLRWSPPARLSAGQTVELAFELETTGPTADDASKNDRSPEPYIEPYMGMPGHAVVVARDLSVFAHIHPTGSVPMAAMALVPGGLDGTVDHSRHVGMRFPPRVRFPYNFPRAGAYRVLVQLKHAGKVETAAFDLAVAAAPR